MALSDPGPAAGPAAVRRAAARWRRHLPAWGWIAALFVASRAAARLAGLRFDAGTLDWAWQFIDPRLLQDRLAESLFYLHGQPPLFNLYLGLVLKLAGAAAPAAFAATFLLATLAAWVASYHLLLFFRLPRWAAVAAPSVYFLGPTALAYESWLFYTWPVAVLLLLASAALAAYLRRPDLARGIAFFALLAVVCLTRSSFHLAWMGAALVFLLAARPRLWRLTLRCSLVPLLLVVAVYAKNQAVFSTFSASSWMWLSLYKMTSYTLLDPSAGALLREGSLSPLALVDAWAEPERYAEVLEPLTGPTPITGVPVLDARRKSTGTANYNHLLYLRSLPLRRHDALTLMRRRPQGFAGILAASCVYFVRSPDDYFAVETNVAALGLWRSAWEAAVYGALPRRGPGSGELPAPLQHLCILVAVLLLATLLATVVLALRRRWRAWSDAEIVFLFLGATVAYASLVSVLFEVTENNRFRVMIEPMLMIAAAVLLHRLAARLRRWWTKESGPKKSLAPGSAPDSASTAEKSLAPSRSRSAAGSGTAAEKSLAPS